MTMRNNNGQNEPDVRQAADAEQAIERLLKLAGPRPDVPEERAARVRAAVQTRWQESVADQKTAAKQARFERWRVPAMGLAAAVVLTVAAVLGVQTLRAPVDVATVQRLLPDLVSACGVKTGQCIACAGVHRRTIPSLEVVKQRREGQPDVLASRLVLARLALDVAPKLVQAAVYQSIQRSA